MRRVIIALAGVVLVGAVACGGSAPSPTAVPEAATVAATVVSAQTATAVAQMWDCGDDMDEECVVDVVMRVCGDDLDVWCVEDVVIGPELEDCVGVAPMRCMVVDGELFYGEIEGFEHEAGYQYLIRMERYDPWGGRPPPADASWRGYRLMDVLEKTRVWVR